YSVGTGGGRGQDIDVEWIKKTIPAIILGAVTGYYVIITVVKYFMSFSRMCPKCLSVDSYRVLSKSNHSSRDYTDSKSKDYYGTIGTIYDKDNNKVGTVNGRLGTVEYTRNVHEENWTERSQCSCCGRIKEYRTGYARKSSWK
ncbi:MAG: hypothetical protein K2J75_03540, partial [Clostridia bacterium]|nr:hypothetical protein [Clostridia bacterium]